MRQGLGLSWVYVSAVVTALCAQSFAVSLTPPQKTSEPEAQPAIELIARPVVDATGNITEVEVETTNKNASAKSTPLAFKIPITCAGITGIADSVHDVVLRDDRGVVELQRYDDLPDRTNFLYWRHWRTVRPVEGAARMSYRFHIAKPIPRSGPPFDLRANAWGVSGAGLGFLILPENKRPFDVSFNWDLRNMKPGSAAASSIGNGNVSLKVPMEALHFSFYIAGPLQTYADESTANGFSAAWLGTPPFDTDTAMAWCAKAYVALRRFFRNSNRAPFRVFMRTGLDNVSLGGAQLINSFMLSVPTKPELTKELNGTVAHEMVHHWVGSLEGTPGLISWFGEGLAEYYSNVEIFRAGITSATQFTATLNYKAVRYYSNPLINMPFSEVPNAFWKTRDGQVIPYDRGFFYFADVDSKLRAASKGKVSLDDLVLGMIDGRARGEPYSVETWLKAVEKVLGPSARQDFATYIEQGKTITVSSSAFGSCFEQKAVTMREFELGFDERATLYSVPRIVQGLVHGSAAESAGLRNDDEILNVIDLNAIRGEDKKLALKIRRARQEFDISYLPRAKEVPGYKWIHVTSVKEENCPLR